MKNRKDLARFSEETCPICGEIFGVPDRGTYAYQMKIRRGSDIKHLFFCKYSHKKQFEEQHEKNKAADREIRNEKARERWKKKKETES